MRVSAARQICAPQQTEELHNLSRRWSRAPLSPARSGPAVACTKSRPAVRPDKVNPMLHELAGRRTPFVTTLKRQRTLLCVLSVYFKVTEPVTVTTGPLLFKSISKAVSKSFQRCVTCHGRSKSLGFRNGNRFLRPKVQRNTQGLLSKQRIPPHRNVVFVAKHADNHCVWCSRLAAGSIPRRVCAWRGSTQLSWSSFGFFNCAPGSLSVLLAWVSNSHDIEAADLPARAVWRFAVER